MNSSAKPATASPPASQNRLLRFMAATDCSYRRRFRRRRRPGTDAMSASAIRGRRVRRHSAVRAASSPGRRHRASLAHSRSCRAEGARVGGNLSRRGSRCASQGGTRVRRRGRVIASWPGRCTKLLRRNGDSQLTVTTCDAPRTPSTNSPPSGWGSRQVASGEGAGALSASRNPAPDTSAGLTASWCRGNDVPKRLRGVLDTR